METTFLRIDASRLSVCRAGGVEKASGEDRICYYTRRIPRPGKAGRGEILRLDDYRPAPAEPALPSPAPRRDTICVRYRRCGASPSLSEARLTPQTIRADAQHQHSASLRNTAWAQKARRACTLPGTQKAQEVPLPYAGVSGRILRL